MFIKSYSQLCAPSKVYLVLSLLCIFMMIFQNAKSANQREFNLGPYSMVVPHIGLIFALKIVMILFWTWILNLICKDGHRNISWLLVLGPFIWIFVVAAIVAMNQK